MNNWNAESSLDLFFDGVTSLRAQLIVRSWTPTGDTQWRITGFVRGPYCQHAQTLPATIALSPLSSQPSISATASTDGAHTPCYAEAILLDPCGWSPALPALYDVHVEWWRGAELVATVERRWGLRLLELRRGQFFLEGRRTVLRVVSAPPDLAGTAALAEMREAGTSLWTRDPDSSWLLSEADQAGVFVVAQLSDNVTEAHRQCRALAMHPSVAMVVVSARVAVSAVWRDLAPNVLVGVLARCDEDWPDDVSRAARIVILPSDFREEDESLTSKLLAGTRGGQAVLALEQLPRPLAWSEARRGCDALQRTLATKGADLAGYLVLGPGSL